MSGLLTPAICGQAVCGKTICGKMDIIELISPPDKMTYAVGEKIDLTGLTVGKVYADGSRETITNVNITTEPSTAIALEETHESLAIKYKGEVFAKLPITVKKEMPWTSFTYTKTIEKRTKKTTATTWSDWSTSTDPLNMGNTIVAMETTAGTIMTQYRTVLQVNASSLNVDLNDKKGIKLLVYKGGSDICYDRGHIIVNGIRQYIYGNVKNFV